jgi:hypothetical protein
MNLIDKIKELCKDIKRYASYRADIKEFQALGRERMLRNASISNDVAEYKKYLVTLAADDSRK